MHLPHGISIRVIFFSCFFFFQPTTCMGAGGPTQKQLHRCVDDRNQPSPSPTLAIATMGARARGEIDARLLAALIRDLD